MKKDSIDGIKKSLFNLFSVAIAAALSACASG